MRVSLKHHYGWESYIIPKSKDKKDAAYQAVRKTHTFLTDDNHTYEVKEKIPLEWGGKTFYHNSVYIYRNENSPSYIGPEWARMDYWFTVEFV